MFNKKFSRSTNLRSTFSVVDKLDVSRMNEIFLLRLQKMISRNYIISVKNIFKIPDESSFTVAVLTVVADINKHSSPSISYIRINKSS